MDWTISRPSHLSLRILIALLFIAPSTFAQQPTPQPLAPAPADSSKDKAKHAQDKDSPDAQVGKSKLEKETGTVNDRIFEVLPNYGTVETSKSLPLHDRSHFSQPAS